MILSELYKLYGRLQNEGAEIPAMGSSLQKMSFLIKIQPDGTLLGIEDYRDTVTERKQTKKGTTEKHKIVSKVIMVPGESKPSGSGLNPCFLWDNAAYLLGYCDPDKNKKDATAGKKAAARALEEFEETRRKYKEFEAVMANRYFSSVCRFLEQWSPDQLESLNISTDILESNGSFEIIGAGEKQLLYALPELQIWWNEGGNAMWKNGLSATRETAPQPLPEQLPMCLITGERAPAAEVHDPAIKGVAGAQSTGAKLVSFNCKAFESYGKEQSENSPVSQKAAFAYCNALNYLLSRKESRQRLGDATVVFWADAPAATRSAVELFFGCSFDEHPEETYAQDEDLLKRVRESLQSISQGICPASLIDISSETRFCVLGLSPNAARLSVRFFHESTFGTFLHNLTDHAQAMRLQKRNAKFNDPDYITPRRILSETVRKKTGTGEAEEIPPAYTGPLMRSILLNLPYPDSIAMAIVRRFHADRHINYVRCAYLKAWLTRKNPTLTIQPMLDTTNTNIGYLLGRLFATLQKTQEDALGDINRSLRDSFYASASVNPRNVFPRLMKLYNHHLAKLSSKGAQINRDKTVRSIIDMIPSFPAKLPLEQQGFFALGFYQQTQDFFTTKEKNTEPSSTVNSHSNNI